MSERMSRYGRSCQYDLHHHDYVPRTIDDADTYSEASSWGATSSVSTSNFGSGTQDGYAPSYNDQGMSEYSVSSAPSAHPAADALDRSMIARPANYPPSTRRLHCEFHVWTGCQDTFRLDEVDLWIRHTEDDHLNRNYPPKCICWFCDDFNFSALRVDDPGLNFEQRMQHIAGHLLDGDRFEQRRPDFHLLDHVYQIGLISPEAFHQAKKLGEGLPPPSEFHPPGWRPPKPEPPVVEKARHRQRRSATQQRYYK